LYALRRLTAAWPTKNRSRRYAPLCGFSPAHFARRWNCCAIPLSRRSKRRIQPERYVPFVLKFDEKMKKKEKPIDRKNNMMYK
jgi:hypothetical protein